MIDEAMIETFLAPYSPEVQDLAWKVRALVLEEIQNVDEQLDTSDKLIAYSFGPRMADMVCVLMPLKSAVNLGFYHGIELPDPAGLLEGTGKRNRHVKIRTAEEIQSPALKVLLKAAVERKKM